MAQTKPSKQTKPQPGTGMQHPEEYRSDLNPNANAGQNIGVAGTHPEKGARTAYEIKELHRQLKHASIDEGLSLHDWILRTLQDRVRNGASKKRPSGNNARADRNTR